MASASTRTRTFQPRIQRTFAIQPSFSTVLQPFLSPSCVYRFSRKLFAFLETMVAFSPFHVANNPNAAGPGNAFYEAALSRYKKVP
jgi:hypothetical protein